MGIRDGRQVDLPIYPFSSARSDDYHRRWRQRSGQSTCDQLAAFGRKVKADIVIGPESRGFIFGAPVAVKMGVGFAPVRKPGKLPRETVSCKYDLEYGSNEVFMSVRRRADRDSSRSSVLRISVLSRRNWMQRQLP